MHNAVAAISLLTVLIIGYIVPPNNTCDYISSVKSTECRFTKLGTSYVGNISETKSGSPCLVWNSDNSHDTVHTNPATFPDGSAGLSGNSCRNPHWKENGPWCFVTGNDDVISWEYCSVPYCDCRTNRAAWDYSGVISTTESGHTCQRWDEQEPHNHGYYHDYLHPGDNATLSENYCRNPGREEPGGPWCYTTDAAVRWEYCDIPYCDCQEEGTDYRGTTRTTSSGLPCQRWDKQTPHAHTYTDPSMFPENDVTLAENFCRNPDEAFGRPWCYTTLNDTRWEYCDIVRCELPVIVSHSSPTLPTTSPALKTTETSVAPTTTKTATATTTMTSRRPLQRQNRTECKFSQTGTSYSGHVTVTVSGRTCQRWDSQIPHRHRYVDIDWFPDQTLEDAHNYCRNPTFEPNGPWCFTADVHKRWEYCDISLCDCKTTKSGNWYMGNVNTTRTGKSCQSWTAQTPHPHPYENAYPSFFPDGSAEDAKNHCRNPDMTSAEGPWCYTTDPKTERELCDVQYCECLGEPHGLNYRGKVNITKSGRQCQRWDLQYPHTHSMDDVNNYCRNPNKRPGGPWCYTGDVDQRWEYCHIPLCELPVVPHIDNEEISKTAVRECMFSTTGIEYRGLENQTTDGEPCLAWSSVDTSGLPSVRLMDAGSTCRNPNGRDGGPWCYTKAAWGYCAIETCDCKHTRSGYDYTGQLNRTITGKQCQRWDAQTPHSHYYTSYDAFPDSSLAEVNNYCRNPDDVDPGGPWCYTTDANARWEPCDIPMCECKLNETGEAYGGRISTTVSGLKCQRWDMQIPYRHVFIFPSMFPNDASVSDARNYCRNPDAAHAQGPWCFTTDLFVKWEYCDVPRCDGKIVISTTDQVFTEPKSQENTKYSPKPTKEMRDRDNGDNDSKPNKGASQTDGDASGDVLQTVGIVVGVAVAIIAAIVVFIVIKRRSNIKHSKSVGGVDNPVFFTSTEKLKA